MYIQFKNRGALVPFYLGTSFLCLLIITKSIDFFFGKDVLVEGDIVLLSGVTFLIAGYWTYKNRDSFYTVDGEERRMGEENVFFYLTMEMWAQIFWSFGALCMLGGALALSGLVND